MRRLAIAAIAAAVLLGCGVQSASARRFSIANAETVEMISWSTLTLEAGGSSVRCPVTLAGKFEANTIEKTTGRRIGSVEQTEVNAAGCTGGSMTFLTETLPWATQYHAFTGTLPNITGVTLDVIGAAIRARISGVECLVRTEASAPARATASVSSGTIPSLRLDETVLIEVTGGGLCSLLGRAHLAGTGTVGLDPEGLGLRLI